MTSYKAIMSNFVEQGKQLANVADVTMAGQRSADCTDVTASGMGASESRQLMHETEEAEHRSIATEKREAARRLSSAIFPHVCLLE